jgi:hypothetical protein
MKKLIILLLAMQCICTANAQWSNKIVDNNFDPIYKVSYTEAYHNVDLRMQNIDGEISLYLTGEFWCDRNPLIELSFLVRDQRKYYSFIGTVVGDFMNVLALSYDIQAESFLEDFKYSRELKIIVQQEECFNEFYEYDMTGSAYAIKFLNK